MNILNKSIKKLLRKQHIMHLILLIAASNYLLFLCTDSMRCAGVWIFGAFLHVTKLQFEHYKLGVTTELDKIKRYFSDSDKILTELLSYLERSKGAQTFYNN